MKMRNTVLKTIFLVVFIGSLLVWVLLPTKSYNKKWTPKLTTKLSSTTYLREQGTNLLLFTFPMMFIGALSCVYLHLQKKSNNKSSSNSGGVTSSQFHRTLASWRNPVSVKAPLGIVSSVEICFVLMFIALLTWSLANYLYVSFGSLHMHKVGEKVWQAKFRSVSLRLGYIGNTCWAFLFFPVTRGSSILPLVGLTSESSIKYHIWLGHLSTVLFTAHTVGFFIYWAMTDQMVDALEWSQTYVSNVAGEIAMVFAFAIWATSLNKVRRKMFELFFYTHHLYTLYIIFYVLHVGSAYLCMILPGIFLFLIDRYLRFLQSRNRIKLLSSRLLPCGAFELNFAKTQELEYNPTSILFINVPTISKLQWHPFTVTSNCNMEPDKLSIVIKSQGSWSQKLYKQLSNVDHLGVSVEGPYGPSSFSFLRHEALIMVCGGSGITPFISIIREIMFQNTIPNSHIPRVVLICAFKNSADLAMLDLLLPISSPQANQISQIELQIEAYVTQESEQPTIEAQSPIQTVLFKPNPLDSPISATLGPNSWLWLGAIISSSFVLFLLVLGLVTRYYIYPVDKSGGFYHYSYRCLWDMFLVCACICLASSVAFVLSNKSRNSKKDNNNNKQIQHLEMETPPTSSPAAWSYVVGNREVESLPNQSLAQAMKVHFGARPDLKKILFESKASDVGVLVCGPRKMRHEVAKICASGLADNLHFESISFNW
ncbi:ferric reduction oxidase 4-like isoform X2 [Cannabis sativa]|uniref:ferric reduction oxidase 4-like isoform X2 n=1 Tax=Cannabis sativa TaxID=3483 RepID=UPI0029CA74D1|nr:ferric reduction oxidase 4-like isoform X2 [Cannabis sativa]